MKTPTLVEYLKTLDVVTVCPYCFNHVDKDRPSCCGETHAMKAFDDGDSIFMADELSLKAEKWIESESFKREIQGHRHIDPMTQAKIFNEENES